MSADFIAAVLEFPKGKEPDWSAARNHIMGLSEHELAVVLNNTKGFDLNEEDEGFIDAVKEELSTTNLVCGGSSRTLSSWGDEPDGVSEMQLFENSGAAKAAGFLV